MSAGLTAGVAQLPGIPSPAEVLLTGLNTFLAKVLLGILSSLLDLLRSTAFTSPDVTVLPQVQQLSAASMAIVDACFVLAVIAAGVEHMTDGLVRVRQTLSESGARLVVAFVAANFANPLCSGLIELANAVTASLTGGDIWSVQALTRLRDLITVAQQDMTGATAFLFTVVLVVIAITTGALVCQWLVRIWLLTVLAAIAPVPLACHALDATDPFARAWWRSLLAALGTQVLQAVSLFLAVRVLLDGQLMVAATGQQTALVHLFVVLVALWATARIPALMVRLVTGAGGGGGGPRLGAFLVRTVLIQRGLNLARRPGGGRGGGPAPVFNVRNVYYQRLSGATLYRRPPGPPSAGGSGGSGGSGPRSGGPGPSGPRRSGPGPRGAGGPGAGGLGTGGAGRGGGLPPGSGGAGGGRRPPGSPPLPHPRPPVP